MYDVDSPIRVIRSSLTVQWSNIAETIYCPTACFAKLSILLQYSRIFNPTGKGNLSMFLTIRIGMCAIFIFYFIEMFFNIFLCNPREKIWNPLITTGTCYGNTAILLQTRGIFNVVSDFAILIMPMPSVWSLKMSLRRKLLTTGVFGSGFL